MSIAEHPLNFGGHPGEAFSHLLNAIVMASSVTSLCVVLLCSIWGQRPGAGTPSRHGELLLSIILAISVLAVGSWAAFLDSLGGEGTVAIVFILLYGPAIALSRVAGQGLIFSAAPRGQRVLAVSAIWAISLGMIWLYEHSETGGPNPLVFPLLILQVGLFWLASRRLALIQKYRLVQVSPR